MEPLTIALIVLVAAAIWAAAELAITLRKTRTVLDEVSHSATEAIDQATPVITKLDGVIDELQPAMREVTPLVEKVTVTVDEATTSLNRVNGILGDVSTATRGVAEVGENASRIVNTATNAAVGVVSKVASMGGITIPEGQQLIGKGAAPGAAADDAGETTAEAGSVPPSEQSSERRGYVTYAPATEDDQDGE